MPYRLSAQSITCLDCGYVSFHPRDMSERYCPHCHVFHDDVERAQRRLSGTPPRQEDMQRLYRLCMHPAFIALVSLAKNDPCKRDHMRVELWSPSGLGGRWSTEGTLAEVMHAVAEVLDLGE